MKEPHKFRKLTLLFDLVFGRKDERLNAVYHLIAYIARKFGIRLYNRSLMWFHDQDYIKIWDGFSIPMKGIEERKYNLYHFALSIKDIPGDTVECGVLQGDSSMIIMKCTEGAQKLHHMFDSFEGLSNVGHEDQVLDSAHYQWREHDLAVPEHVVENNLQSFPQKRMYKGWIPDRFNEIDSLTFAFVHIDVDLYQPTFDSISYFYDKVSTGGLIVCDDYGFETCPGAYKAINEFMNDKKEHIIHLTTGQSVIIKQ